MSLARHKLANSRHSLHSAKKTFTVGGGGSVIVYPKTVSGGVDGDSSINFANGAGIVYGTGVISPIANDEVFSVGMSNIGGNTTTSLALMSFDLFADAPEIKATTIIKSAVLHLNALGQDGFNDGVGGPQHEFLEIKNINVYRNRHITEDVRYGSWVQHGVGGGDVWSTAGAGSSLNDYDATVKTTFKLGLLHRHHPNTFKQAINFLDLTRDAVASRSGKLSTVWKPDEGETLFTNRMHFYSSNSLYQANRPRLEINFFNP